MESWFQFFSTVFCVFTHRKPFNSSPSNAPSLLVDIICVCYSSPLLHRRTIERETQRNELNFHTNTISTAGSRRKRPIPSQPQSRVPGRPSSHQLKHGIPWKLLYGFRGSRTWLSFLQFDKLVWEYLTFTFQRANLARVSPRHCTRWKFFPRAHTEPWKSIPKLDVEMVDGVSSFLYAHGSQKKSAGENGHCQCPKLHS